MTARKHLFGVGLLLAVVVSVPALAQQPPTSATTYTRCVRTPKTSESDQAHAKYLAGKVDYDEGKYAEAIRQFREAYAKDCEKHDLLVYISFGYEKKAATSASPVADLKEAIRALEAFIQFSPASPDVPTYKTKIETLKTQIEKRSAAPTATAPTTMTTTTSTAPAPSNTTSPPPPGGDKQGHTVYPWLVVGAGAIAVAVGIVVIVTAPALPDGCDRDRGTCSVRPGETKDPPSSSLVERNETAGKAKNQPIYGGVAVGGGVLLVGGGLLWHFLEPTGAKEGKAKFRPQLGPAYGGLALSGSF